MGGGKGEGKNKTFPSYTLTACFNTCTCIYLISVQLFLQEQAVHMIRNMEPIHNSYTQDVICMINATTNKSARVSCTPHNTACLAFVTSLC